MKKVMIGILILIPIIILLIVAMVSTIVSAQTHIAVENIELVHKGTNDNIYELPLSLEGVADKVLNLRDYLDVVVYPQKANNYTIEWKISGEVTYTDEEYLQRYRDYLDNPDLPEVWPAATFVDENGKETASNTSGKIVIGSFCTFTVQVVAENVSKTLNVKVVGYDVQRVDLRTQSGFEGKLGVGDSMRLLPSYTPIDSIVNNTVWTSSDDSVLRVDDNGVVTAVGVGQAKITLKASVYTSEKENKLRYVEGSIDVNVESKGASSKFGLKLVTSKRSFTCEEIGVAKDEITSLEGLDISEDGILTMSASTAVLTVRGGAQLTIASCVDGDIAINNARFYENESGYVLAVGENVLDLDVAWADMLESEHTQGEVSWTSSDESIATVDGDGKVKGLASGLVVITVSSKQGKSARVTINVQNKLASVQLRTSNASLAVGLARETVFASERFANPTNVRIDDTKEANSTLIVVEGDKENWTSQERAMFYSAFVFEITKGGEYAHFDENVRNKLVFDSQNLEGKGKQQVVVKVSAKYPKYEGMTKFTTQEVTINVIYGVAVSSVAEIEVASKQQRAYAESDQAKANGNWIESEERFYFQNENDGRWYRVQSNPSSKNTYAICFEGNIAYTKENDGEVLSGPDDRLNFYGDVYGNNHMLTTQNNQLGEYDKLSRISWSNVTMSNLIMRANTPEEGDEINTADDTKDFTGVLVTVGSHVNWDWYRLENIRMEYCIFENATQAVNVYNADIAFDGCIVRNLNSCGINTYVRMHRKDEVDYPFYTHVDMHNFVFSNTLGSILVVNYENVLSVSSGDTTGANCRFVEGKMSDETAAAANLKWFMDNMYSRGINFVLNQTGFLDAYNWQPVSSATLLDAGDPTLNEWIATLSDTIMRTNSIFANRRVIDSKDTCWIHVAFISAGIVGSAVEKTYPQVNIQDSRLSHFNTESMKSECTGLASLGEEALKNFRIGIWGYDNKQNIQPTTKCPVNDALIDRLHSR